MMGRVSPAAILGPQSRVVPVEIPNRSVFRAQEVCELAQVQPFVLRTWEAEFPDLGVAKTAGSPRVYRRSDVERVLRLKHLLLVDGLTLAGARRRLAEEGPVDAGAPVTDADVSAMLTAEARDRIREVKRGLQWMCDVLSARAGSPVAEFELRLQPMVAASSRAQEPAPPARAKASRSAARVKSKKR
jgi:DNA-binding transcriptional MerR regulator